MQFISASDRYKQLYENATSSAGSCRIRRSGRRLNALDEGLNSKRGYNRCGLKKTGMKKYPEP